MKIYLKIWRQKNYSEPGFFEDFCLDEVSSDLSLLEALDLLNERLTRESRRPISFDSDCREGICGTCGFLINGRPHGGFEGLTTCQVYLRKFKNEDTLVLEPFRGGPFRIITDLVVDRSKFDEIITAGGYISASVGQAPEANSILVPKEIAEEAFDAAACIGCGACVAACPNGSAMLFTSAKIYHLNKLPQGRPEAKKRASRMISKMIESGFGACSLHGECETVCPKKISLKVINFALREARR
ncbi:MAG: succinate dehydrogenase/fumarate reductase iron-sulfur subunit [Deltaproteobacteria bacterium]|nr:succinate dehydrogenase/fumarate reductase iron-sulfur subunit [Deltaproteobacteria bacterium]MCX7952973.1 succinate dehydrogenase/fumarate reductase iron-sulfur subunit [Deltaproteobacteria bacterium]